MWLNGYWVAPTNIISNDIERDSGDINLPLELMSKSKIYTRIDFSKKITMSERFMLKVSNNITNEKFH